MLSAKRDSVRVLYSGRVQGVGFRYTARTVAQGFDVCGAIRNLADGRVELEATGEREELDAFLQALRDSGLGPCIRQEDLAWGISVGPFKGFEIVR